jgi:gamma-glutamylcyclotransferase (GGCT)/AIG2-like uncharacterized protein YtfP
MSNRLFVYGTLIGAVPKFDKGARFIGNATIKGNIYSLGGFPGLKLAAIRAADAESTVNGEVWEVTSFRKLDQYEGYMEGALTRLNMYDRILVESSIGECFTYVYNGLVMQGNLIPNGDWVTFKSTRN